MSNYYHITGASTMAPRLEIHKFAEDKAVLNLFLLSLAKLQYAKDQKDTVSFFQVGGIHGLPYTAWDGVPVTENTGYCTHRSVLFPTWHRVYMRLIEVPHATVPLCPTLACPTTEALQEAVTSLANEYTDASMKAEFLEAAKRLRHPYWDWALFPRLPNALIRKTVDVLPPPLGLPAQIENPLATYNFHPLDPSFEGPFAVWLRTLRDPGTHEEPRAEDASRPAAVDATLQDPKHRLQVLTHLVVLMLFVRDWASMSNAADGEWSLEGVHDSLHLYIGGDGHMADVGMAGFDPIVYFHHTNVDRLLAIWQALHPGKKVAPGSSRGGTSTIPPNTTVDESTDLTPFRLTDAKFWKSSETYRATDFGSYYPQLGPHATQAEAYAFVKELQAHIGRPLDTNHREWVVSAELKPRELPKSGFVHVFLSPDAPAAAEAGSWLRHETLVGSTPIFITNSTQCANCNQFDESGRKIHGQVFLTDSLLDKGHDLGDDEKVEEYLQKHIHWGLALTNGQEVPLTSVPSLVVKVQSAQIHAPQGGAVERNDGGLDFPTIDPFKIHHSVTVGKLRGYNPDQA